jgi:gamma-glutamylcyclotransferase (GGCT)/AIG2-like uncharacterized protein YtfP
VFFYGTLMTPFNRPGRTRVSSDMVFKGRGTISAALYDLGIYPAAIPTDDGSRVRGEVYELRNAATVLATLDEIEGYRITNRSAASTCAETPVTFDDGQVQPAWAYFYNAALCRAQLISSGDYIEHLNVRIEDRSAREG